MHLLLIEPDIDRQILLVSHLTRKGHRVSTTDSAEYAREVFINGIRFDAVITTFSTAEGLITDFLNVFSRRKKIKVPILLHHEDRLYRQTCNGRPYGCFVLDQIPRGRHNVCFRLFRPDFLHIDEFLDICATRIAAQIKAAHT